MGYLGGAGYIRAREVQAVEPGEAQMGNVGYMKDGALKVLVAAKDHRKGDDLDRGLIVLKKSVASGDRINDDHAR